MASNTIIAQWVAPIGLHTLNVIITGAQGSFPSAEDCDAVIEFITICRRQIERAAEQRAVTAIDAAQKPEGQG